MPVEHKKETTSQKIGTFLLEIMFFLTDFAKFRAKLVFCIQAEIIFHRYLKDIPLLRDDQKLSLKKTIDFGISDQISVLYTSGNYHFIYF